MSVEPKIETTNGTGIEDGWVQLPVIIDAHGHRVVTLSDGQGRPQVRRVAEIVLESFVGPCPRDYCIHFKDGDRLNCLLSNLEWVPGVDIDRENERRAHAIASRERADSIRRSLEGRVHSDSAELLAEDRLR